jgi:hypothetical protein
MNARDRIEMFEEDSRILEEIARQYSETSREHAAVRHAAIALWYALTEGHERFKKYIETFEGDLTEEQRTHLREMGIDPDSEV